MRLRLRSGWIVLNIRCKKPRLHCSRIYHLALIVIPCLLLLVSSPFHSPPPDDISMERNRSRRDVPPLSRRGASDSDSYSSTSILREPLTSGRRSTSVTMTPQFRSKSPPRHSSSPASGYSRDRDRDSTDLGFPPRTLRSASGTPQGSPKKRQLPIIPPARERLAQVRYDCPLYHIASMFLSTSGLQS
jgi:hypothetical protein